MNAHCLAHFGPLDEVGNKRYDKDKTYEIACIAVEHLRRGDSHDKVKSMIATCFKLLF